MIDRETPTDKPDGTIAKKQANEHPNPAITAVISKTAKT